MTSPKRTPKWLFDTYGYTAVRWGRAVDQAYRVLMRWAQAGSPGTYTALVKEVDELDWPDGAWTQHGSQVGNLLGHVSVHEWLDRRPLLSSLAVLGEGGEASNAPGDGFYRLAVELGFDVGRSSDERFEYWWREVQRCIDEWRAKPLEVPDWRRHLEAEP